MAEGFGAAQLTQDVECYVLFDAPLQFAMADVLDGLRQVYPNFKWDGEEADAVFDTTDLVHTRLKASGRSGHVMVEITALPGRLPGRLDVPIARSKLFPNAADAVARHQSYLCISAKSQGSSLTERFFAAAHVTCVSALFAAMETTQAVFYPSADMLLKPENWLEAAATAHLEEWPIEHWVSFHLSKVHRAEARPPEFSCGSLGMAAFTGQEVAFPLAPVAPADAAKAVCGAVYLLSTGGDLFSRASALDLDDGYPPLAIRHLEEGAHGAQTDTWLLVHPLSRLYGEDLGTTSEDAPVIRKQGVAKFTIPQKRSERLN